MAAIGESGAGRLHDENLPTLINALFGPERRSEGVRSEAFRLSIPDEELIRLADLLEDRHGPYRGVVVDRNGLWVVYERGREPVVARVESDGLLSALLVGPVVAPPSWWQRRAVVRLRLAGVILQAPVVLVLSLVVVWQAGTIAGVLGDVVAGGVAWAIGRRAAGNHIVGRRPRAALDVLFAAVALSALRAWSLPPGQRGSLLADAVGLGGVVATVMVLRSHPADGPEADTRLRWPLGPGNWAVFAGGVRRPNHHWPSRAQRYALDLVALRPSGARAVGWLPRRLEAYAIYGAEVLAPADGEVCAAVDGEPDQVPGEIRPAFPAGNYVAIDTGSETVHLCHLMPGSLAVSVGDRVRIGEALGRVGNSGRSTEPHLHIHIEDRDGVGRRPVFDGIDPRQLVRGGEVTVLSVGPCYPPSRGAGPVGARSAPALHCLTRRVRRMGRRGDGRSNSQARRADVQDASPRGMVPGKSRPR